MTEEMIKKYIEAGFKRWQKGNFDRLYINADELGLDCSYYKSGNISGAEFNGEHISNSEARRMKAAKTFVDVKTGELHGTNDRLLEAAEELMERIESEAQEAETEESCDLDTADDNSDSDTTLDDSTEQEQTARYYIAYAEDGTPYEDGETDCGFDSLEAAVQYIDICIKETAIEDLYIESIGKNRMQIAQYRADGVAI